MPSSNPVPGAAGIIVILGGVVGVGVIMSLALDMWSHWVPLSIAIIVGLWAVQSINGR